MMMLFSTLSCYYYIFSISTGCCYSRIFDVILDVILITAAAICIDDDVILYSHVILYFYWMLLFSMLFSMLFSFL